MGGAASAEKKGSGLTASTGDLETVAPPDRSAHLPRAARPSHNVIGSGSSAAAEVQTQHASPAKPKQRHNSLPSTEVERMKFDEAHSVKESRTESPGFSRARARSLISLVRVDPAKSNARQAPVRCPVHAKWGSGARPADQRKALGGVATIVGFSWYV